MRRSAGFYASLAVLLLAIPAGGQSTPEIGSSVAVKGEVSKEVAAKAAKFQRGDSLKENEALVTGKGGTAEIALVDEAKIAVGPDSRVAVEPPADAADPQGGYTVNLSRGSLRFVTAKGEKRTYRIKTPTAYVTTRAGVFDVFVADNGEVAVLVHEGAVDICPRPASCRRHNTVGRFVHVTSAGVLSDPLKWDGTFFKGVAIASAFPFVGRSLKIDPIRRLRHAELIVNLPLDPTRQLKAPLDGRKTVPLSIERSVPRPRLPF